MKYIHDYRQRASVLTALVVFATLSWAVALSILMEIDADRGRVILFMTTITISSFIVTGFVASCQKEGAVNRFLTYNPELIGRDRLSKERDSYRDYTMILALTCVALSDAAAVTTLILLIAA